ncbi:hypothetical protein BGZ88_005138 [Linnemannia elongata]|nr:hypothetical protein BGZ88_005138 [Linnemannia elongata]
MVSRKSFCILLFLAVLVTFSSVSSAHPVLDKVEKRDVSVPNRLVKRLSWGDVGNWFKGAAKTVAKSLPAIADDPAMKAKFARVAKAVSNIRSSKCAPQKRSYFIHDELMKRDGEPPAGAGQTPTQSETQVSPEDEAYFEQMFQEMFGAPAESVPENDPELAEMLELFEAFYALDGPAPAGAEQP